MNYIIKLIKWEKVIWYPENQRGKLIINPREQMLFAFKMMSVSFSSSLLLGIFSLTYIRTSLPPSLQQQMTVNFTVGFICLALIFNLLVFYIGLILSHRRAGPLYAFELYVEELLEGKRDELKLREGDNYRHLEKIGSDLLQHFKQKD